MHAAGSRFLHNENHRKEWGTAGSTGRSVHPLRQRSLLCIRHRQRQRHTGLHLQGFEKLEIALGRRQGSLALDKRDSYGNKWFWAPEVYLIDGTYYMYYSAEEHICVATSESPLGPFRQKEKRPMIEGRNIDNSLFIDPNGQAYLFWVKIDTCNAIWVCELEKDLQTPRPDTARPCISMSQEWEKIWPSVNEGPFVIRHKGTYYLTYSANSYECPDYGIGYATADHPLGPWTKSEHNPILQSPGTLQGCGHHAVFRDKRHRYRVVFHAHHAPGQISPRIMHFTRLKFIPQKNTADRLIFLPDYFTPRLTRD